MSAQLLLDLVVEELAGLAVDDVVDEFERATIEDGKLEEIGVRDDAGNGPTSRRRHFHLPLNQSLADFEVGVELAALEELGLDPAACRRFDLGEIVLDRDVAEMGRRGVERAAQP